MQGSTGTNRHPKAVVVHSPFSGRSAQFLQALALLQQAGVDVIEVISIDKLDPLSAQGSSWQELGADMAIAAGGDGLVGGVITHIAESALPLGILPLGTSNDIARSLSIPLNLPDCIQTIISGKVEEVDVGTAQPAEQAPHLAAPSQQDPVLAQVPLQKHGYFAHALTVGLNVQFARLATNVATRQRFGRLAYPVAALEVLRNHEPLEISLHCEGLAFPKEKTTTPAEEQTSLHYRAVQVAVINAPIFGGQWQLAVPRASIADRLLDVVVIEDIDLEQINTAIAEFFRLQRQPAPVESMQHSAARHPAELSGIPGIHHFQATKITIATSRDPRDVTLDGEVRGQTPVHVHMADKRLRVLVP